jgi:hypothetical protein
MVALRRSVYWGRKAPFDIDSLPPGRDVGTTERVENYNNPLSLTGISPKRRESIILKIIAF